MNCVELQMRLPKSQIRILRSKLANPPISLQVSPNSKPLVQAPRRGSIKQKEPEVMLAMIKLGPVQKSCGCPSSAHRVSRGAADDGEQQDVRGEGAETNGDGATIIENSH